MIQDLEKRQKREINAIKEVICERGVKLGTNSFQFHFNETPQKKDVKTNKNLLHLFSLDIQKDLVLRSFR